MVGSADESVGGFSIAAESTANENMGFTSDFFESSLDSESVSPKENENAAFDSAGALVFAFDGFSLVPASELNANICSAGARDEAEEVDDADPKLRDDGAATADGDRENPSLCDSIAVTGRRLRALNQRRTT